MLRQVLRCEKLDFLVAGRLEVKLLDGPQGACQETGSVALCRLLHRASLHTCRYFLTCQLTLLCVPQILVPEVVPPLHPRTRRAVLCLPLIPSPAR